ncbi:MAG: sirohydrochlorin chelatase [Armatimonadota bacterium]
MTDKSQPDTRCGKTAIILLGHGSRAAGAAEDMEKVVLQLRNDPQYEVVEICQMSGLGDHFPEVFDRCVASGATKVVVVPYFLHFGVHMREDVPAMMMEKAQQHPHVKLILGKHIGYDDALVGIIKKRILESDRLRDIRDTEMEGGS